MDSSTIDLKGSQIESITLDGGVARVRFAQAYLIKTMTGSAELTRWWQAGTLMLEDARLIEGALPQNTCVCAGGEIEDNIYTYRDMLPIPLDSRGHVRCLLRLDAVDAPLIIEAGAIRLVLDETPRYIEHIRPGAQA